MIRFLTRRAQEEKTFPGAAVLNNTPGSISHIEILEAESWQTSGSANTQSLPHLKAAASSGGQNQSHQARSKSALEHVITLGLPSVDEILFLRAACPLPRVTVMGMEMRRSVFDGVLQRHVPLKPLMQIPCLGNVDGRPIALRQLFGIDVHTGQWSKRCIQRIDLECILLPGLPRPVVSGGDSLIRMGVATE
jgi:hypothetical protein